MACLTCLATKACGIETWVNVCFNICGWKINLGFRQKYHFSSLGNRFEPKHVARRYNQAGAVRLKSAAIYTMRDNVPQFTNKDRNESATRLHSAEKLGKSFRYSWPGMTWTDTRSNSRMLDRDWSLTPGPTRHAAERP